MSREVLRDGGAALSVRFSFDRRLVEVIKTLPRRRWQAEDKTWRVPDDDVVALVDLLLPEGFEFDEDVRRLYAERGGTRALPSSPARPRGAPARGLFDAEPERALGPDAPEAPADHFTVGRLNREVGAVLAAAFPSPVWLAGEISGFNRNRHKRHVSFTLVERDAAGETAYQVAAILFEDSRREIERKLAAAEASFALEDEIEVRVRVRVDLYDAWGAYRVVVEDLDVAFTLGEAARRREEIIRQLGALGLLGRNAELPFPELPLRVGLITSLGSDAYHDVMRTLGESGFAFRVVAHGARVQGRSTESTVLNALDWFRARAAHFDVLLVCRGGGSRTDLAWFDALALGRAVALLPIPIVVGIGHEQDVSVLDHVGRRAKTPTAAASMLVDRVRSALERVVELGSSILAEATARIEAEKALRREEGRRLARAVRAFLDVERVEVRRLREHLVRATARYLTASRVDLLASARQLGQAARRDLADERRRTAEARRSLAGRATRAMALETERAGLRERRLHLLDPRRVVERGYAILRTSGGAVVTDVAVAPQGQRLTAELRSGRLALISEGPDRGGRKERA